MEIINDTPFSFGLLPGRIYFPKHSLTLMVKATFQMRHQASPQLTEEQVFPEGDVFYEGDDEGNGSVFYESDFAYAKTATDCFLVGKCCGERPARVRRVDFKIGEHLKSLAVFGKRVWNSGNTISEPEPFEAIPLKYEYALGGPGYNQNPVGLGATEQQARGYVLPYIEYADQLMQSPQSRPPVAGFGPLNRSWLARSTKLGTYTSNYAKERWPWFPEDFDWSYFNAAPSDQQIKPFLKGDEPVFVTSMHRQHEVFETRLPGLRARIFVSTSDQPDPEYFSEVKANLDTLWLNMDDLSLRMVWRGWLPVSNDEYPELKHCFVYAEPTTINTPLNVVYERFHTCWQELQDEPDEEESEDRQRPDEAELKALRDKEIAEARQAMRAHLISLGVDPQGVDEAIAKAVADEEAREAGAEQPKVWTRELFLLAAQQRRDFSGEDLSAVDFSGLTLQGMNFSQADLTGSNFSRATLQQCDFTQAICSKCDFRNGVLNGTALTGADLFKADFGGALLNQVDMSGAYADEAGFQQVQATELVCVEASISNARLNGLIAPACDFSGTDFSYSDLSNADLHKAKLAEASIEGCIARQINLMLAQAPQLKASEGLIAEGANFCQLEAPDSIWEEANLDQCNFTYAQMQGATLNKVTLRHADISAGDFKGGKFMSADLTGTKAVMINLFEGTFEKAQLVQTDLRGANLYGVEFLDANIQQSLFESANLAASKLAQGGGV